MITITMRNAATNNPKNTSKNLLVNKNSQTSLKITKGL